MALDWSKPLVTHNGEKAKLVHCQFRSAMKGNKEYHRLVIINHGVYDSFFFYNDLGYCHNGIPKFHLMNPPPPSQWMPVVIGTYTRSTVGCFFELTKDACQYVWGNNPGYKGALEIKHNGEVVFHAKEKPCDC